MIQNDDSIRVSLKKKMLKSVVNIIGRILLNIHEAFSGAHIQRLGYKYRFIIGEPKIASALNICVWDFGPLLNHN